MLHKLAQSLLTPFARTFGPFTISGVCQTARAFASAASSLTTCRTMFVTHRAPHRAFRDGQIVNAILQDAGYDGPEAGHALYRTCLVIALRPGW